MRVLALGGAGQMGLHACRVAAGLDSVTGLIVTDLDGSRAERAAADLGPKAIGRALDVSDAATLSDAVRGVDVVMNTVGPFFRFGPPILRAAVEAGRSYVDICDDPEPIAAMFALAERARDTGATALVGMGASPGITNLLAVIAARELDTVEEIITGWSIDAGRAEKTPAGQPPSAAIVHAVQQLTGTIPTTGNGRTVHEPALRRRDITYPGIGRRKVWTFGHPEAITLPRAFPTVKTCLNVTIGGGMSIGALTAIRFLVGRGMLSARRAATLVQQVERRLPDKPEQALRPGRLPPLFALATGTREGQPATVGCALAQLPGLTMGEVTGIPLGVTLDLLPRTAAGVHSPETLLDPAGYFAALAPYCVGNPAPDDMVVTTRSWDTDSSRAIEAAQAHLRTLIATG